MLGLTSDPPARVCIRCATQLPRTALACPACATLVHRERLEQLAALATTAATAGDVATARTHWQEARDLVPPRSEQYQHISDRLLALVDPVDATQPAAVAPTHTPWGRVLGGVALVATLLLGKLKFLLLGLSKITTLFSMFGFIAVYWSVHGWPLAVGLAVSIYIHEMGHVAVLRRYGIRADAPLFIPGVGALIMLREHITDPILDARIGLAGPVWGLGAAVAAWLTYLATGAPIWLAIAELTGFINLFNLIPIWQLDGSCAFHALSRQERWGLVGLIAIVALATHLGLLWIVGGVALYRTLRTANGPGHTPTFLTFGGLVIALSWFAMGVY
jgi:Zn-dependent protease